MAPRKKWDEERMKEAVDVVRRKEMGSFKAARIYNVPQTTLERYVKLAESNQKVKPIGRQQALSEVLEADLVEYCKIMEGRFYGLSVKDVKSMAYQLAVRNNINTSFSKKNEQAGWKWLKNFFKRNPQLSVRQPQGLSMARAKGFNPNDVKRFFDLYEPSFEKIKNNPARLYNCDEAGITIVQTKHTKVVALKGKRRVASLQSAERGALITVVTCMSPTGHYIPPLIIFPRKNMKLELMNGTPPGSVYDCHPSGWIQCEIFTRWMQHFISHVKPTADDPVLLVLDGHTTHTRNLDVITTARDNNVTIVSLPPHSSHRMQPLDVAFMKPLKTFYAKEIKTWLRGNVGRVVTIYQVGELFGNAYLKAVTAQNAANGFKNSGLYPINKHIFGDQDFPHFVGALESASTNAINQVPNQDLNRSIEVHSIDPLLPSCSNSSTSVQREYVNKQSEPSPIAMGRESDISPIPKMSEQDLKKHSRSQVAEIITSTPHKKSVEDEKRKKLEKESKQKLKIVKKVGVAKNKTKKNDEKKHPIRKVKKESVITLEDNKKVTREKSAIRPKRDRPMKKKVFRKLWDSSSESDEEEQIVFADDSADHDYKEGDAECLYCTGLFSEDRNGEDLLRCKACSRWSHLNCADVGNAVFVCDFCAKRK